MTFLYDIFNQLKSSSGARLLQEIRDGEIKGATGGELLELIRQARGFLASKGLKKGDRCALLAQNSIHWVAMDLAIMAEGLIVVPLYARQAPVELVGMMKDCWPGAIVCGDVVLSEAIEKLWPDGPPHVRLDDVFTREGNGQGPVHAVE